MKRVYQAFYVCAYNFRGWRKNPRIIITFLLTFILCFMLTDKVISLAQEYNTSMQMFEPFVWTFGDGGSILLMSLLLVLLFSDIPFITAGTPYCLMRTRRKTWIAGQVLYIITATLIFLVFVLISTMVLCMKNAFSGNIWSKTAATLGFSGDGAAASLTVSIKTLELSRPVSCTLNIFALMLMYTLVMALLMLVLDLRLGKLWGSAGVFTFSLFGFLLKPSTIAGIFKLPEELMYKANVAIGWISPLNHATYQMHNFGYDHLPRLWQSYAIFGILIILLVAASIWEIKKYNFYFGGTEQGGV